jgi:hypothetical protein
MGIRQRVTASAPSRRIWLVRIALPTAIAIAGVVLLVAVSAGLGASLIAVALVVVFANALVRLGIASDADRQRDDDARSFFERTGHWPGEA